MAIGLPIRRFVRPVIGPLVAAGAMCAAMRLALSYGGTHVPALAPDHHVVRLFAGAAFGIAVYAALIPLVAPRAHELFFEQVVRLRSEMRPGRQSRRPRRSARRHAMIVVYHAIRPFEESRHRGLMSAYGARVPLVYVDPMNVWRGERSLAAAGRRASARRSTNPTSIVPGCDVSCRSGAFVSSRSRIAGSRCARCCSRSARRAQWPSRGVRRAAPGVSADLERAAGRPDGVRGARRLRGAGGRRGDAQARRTRASPDARLERPRACGLGSTGRATFDRYDPMSGSTSVGVEREFFDATGDAAAPALCGRCHGRESA